MSALPRSIMFDRKTTAGSLLRLPCHSFILITGLFFIPLLFAASVLAQGGPPMITDDTETVPTGHWEINTALTIEHTSAGTAYETPLLDINYGLNKRTQLKVEIPWVLLRENDVPGVNGLGNVNIGVRWRFRDEKEKQRIALSIYPTVSFNTSQRSVRLGIVDKGPQFFMPLQWQTTIGKFGINGDVGYLFKRGGDEFAYGVVVGRDFKKFELLAEYHGEGPVNNMRDSDQVYNFGSRVPLSKHFTLLLSAGSSLRPHHDPRFIGYFGVQTNF